MKRAFTLLELLVCVALISLLLALTLPGLARARASARAAACGSNVRQLAIAVQMYAQENRGLCVPGASDFLANLHRWHGERATTTVPFDGTRGPLLPFLGGEQTIRSCPSFEPEAGGTLAFERGCGGYGYNNAYLGVRLRHARTGPLAIETDRLGAALDRVPQPAATLMFADAAFLTTGLVEYSFAEPRFHPTTGTRADPSIHFRHLRRASVAWADGHVTRESRAFSWSSGLYADHVERRDLGWFGAADDNRLFDLE